VLDNLPVRIRDLRKNDLAGVSRIDALHTDLRKREYWKRVFGDFMETTDETFRIGLAAEADDMLVGYLFGEMRAFEFGSEACGWIFAVGVDPPHLRSGVGSTLLAEAVRRFRQAGAGRVRTMVRRNNVPVLSFLRTNGFAGGSFVQLELTVEED